MPLTSWRCNFNVSYDEVASEYVVVCQDSISHNYDDGCGWVGYAKTLEEVVATIRKHYSAVEFRPDKKN